MAPKKKGNKKAADDWEADLGETITPQEAATPPQQEADAAQPEEDALGGGLMAALQRRGKKKKNKGGDEDWVQGEDAPTNEALEAKVPVEATFDDEDVFAGNANKKKGKPVKEEVKEEKKDDGPRVKTKAEKEKEKKEKEKQRKKELVSSSIYSRYFPTISLLPLYQTS